MSQQTIHLDSYLYLRANQTNWLSNSLSLRALHNHHHHLFREHNDLANLKQHHNHYNLLLLLLLLIQPHSDWLSEGCKLVSSNRTHSTCACNQLATFGLLTEWDGSAIGSSGTTGATTNSALPSSAASGAESANQQEQARRRKVQLDSVENELILPYKPLYLAQVSAALSV